MDNLNLSMEKAIDEVIADACEMMLQDGSAVTELAAKNKSLWENIKAFINTIVEKLKNAFKGVSESSAAAVELKNILGEWTELQKMWNEALMESEQFETVKSNNAEVFSIDKSYKNKLQQWYESKSAEERLADSSRFHIGKTSEALQKIGVDLYDIYIPKGKIQKILNKHPEININVIKQIPELLENPIIVLQSHTKPKDSIIVLGEVYDKNGNSIMASLNIKPENRKGKVMKIGIVTSAYTKDSYKYQKMLDNNNIYYVNPNKKITDSWLSAQRLQLPTVITKYGYIGNITQDMTVVNSESEDYFSQEINSLSPRFILASTLMNATTSEEEQEHLTKYKEAITSIEDKEERLKITRNAIRNAIFEREAGLVVSKESINNMKKAAKNLERSIDYWDKKLLELEATTPLKNLMERQRKNLSEKYMKEARTRLDDSRARFYASNRREQIKKNANNLISWLTRPDNTHYILYV